MLKLFVMFLFFKSVDPQGIDMVAIESVVESNSKSLISDESTVVKVLTSLNSSIIYSSLNLKTGKLAANLSTVMNKAVLTAQDLQSTQNFEQFLNFTNPSLCDYFFYRMGMLQLDTESYQTVIDKIQENVTRLYLDSRDIYWYFQVYYKSLEMNWTRQLSVFTAFRFLWSTFKEYSYFSALVKANIAYMDKLYTYLDQSLASANCLPFNSTIKTQGDQLEADLVLAESELIGLENVALQKVRNALQTVTSTARSTSDSPTRSQLITLESILEKTTTKNDYPKLKWPRIPDASDKGDNGFYCKVRSCKSKAKKYRTVDYNVNKNKTKIQTTYDALSKTVASNSRKVRAASPAVNDVIVATGAVLTKYTDYSSRIAKALGIINQIVAVTTSPCTKMMNLTNSKGNYMKTACLVQSGQNFNGAQTACQVNNMPSLYAITNADDYTGIKNFASNISMDLFGATVGKKYIIGGVQQPDGRWVNRNVLMSSTGKVGIPTYCLFIEGWSGTLKFRGMGCGKFYAHGICEYNKNTQTPGACAAKYDVLSASSAYIKTVCLMQVTTDAIKNHQNCKNSGMSGLYTMTNTDEVNGIKNYLISLGSITGAVFEIGGWGFGSNWIYPDGQNFFIAKPDIFDAGCLCIDGFPGVNNFLTNPYPCTDNYWFICEFKYEIL